MSKNRMINTKFWDDAYSSNLDPIEKLLFLYFLTNTSTNICGIYEIPLKKIANETGVDKDMVEKVISRFEKDHKIYYRNGWCGLVNFIKNQNQKSPQVKKGIERELDQVPIEIKQLVLEGIDTLSHLTKPNLTKPNLSSAKAEAKLLKYDPLGGEILKAFESVDPKNKTMYGNTTQRKACDFLLSEYGLERILKAISILPQVNQEKLYIAQITTPYELQQNWVKLGNLLRQKGSEHNKLKSNVAF